MSGGYDLMVIVQGKNLHAVATFVSERLATIEGFFRLPLIFSFAPIRSMVIIYSKKERIRKNLLLARKMNPKDYIADHVQIFQDLESVIFLQSSRKCHRRYL